MLYGKSGALASTLLILLGAYKMGEVVEIKPDSIVYIKNFQHEIVGVGDTESGVEFISDPRSITGVYTPNTKACVEVGPDNFKELCIAWLALNYPDVLKFDDEGE